MKYYKSLIYILITIFSITFLVNATGVFAAQTDDSQQKGEKGHAVSNVHPAPSPSQQINLPAKHIAPAPNVNATKAKAITVTPKAVTITPKAVTSTPNINAAKAKAINATPKAATVTSKPAAAAKVIKVTPVTKTKAITTTPNAITATPKAIKRTPKSITTPKTITAPEITTIPITTTTTPKVNVTKPTKFDRHHHDNAVTTTPTTTTVTPTVTTTSPKTNATTFNRPHRVNSTNTANTATHTSNTNWHNANRQNWNGNWGGGWYGNRNNWNGWNNNSFYDVLIISIFSAVFFNNPVWEYPYYYYSGYSYFSGYPYYVFPEDYVYLQEPYYDYTTTYETSDESYGNYSNEAWVEAQNGDVPPNAIPVNNDNQITYICRIQYEGEIHYGQIVPDDGCYITDNNNVELRATDYEVLVAR